MIALRDLEGSGLLLRYRAGVVELLGAEEDCAAHLHPAARREFARALLDMAVVAERGEGESGTKHLIVGDRNGRVATHATERRVSVHVFNDGGGVAEYVHLSRHDARLLAKALSIDTGASEPVLEPPRVPSPRHASLVHGRRRHQLA